MPPVQSLHTWWFVIPDCTPEDTENIYSVQSNDATRKRPDHIGNPMKKMVFDTL
jgi:hypothetical protein